MKEEKFTKILGEIDEKYVNEVMEESKPRRFVPFKKWAALAACFCIIAISATVVVAEVFDIKFIGNGIDFSSRHKTNYYFKVEIEEEYLSEDVFGKRFAEAKEGLAKSVDWAAGCPDCKKNAPNACEFHISHGTWRKAFREGPEEALDIIGCEEIIYPKFDYDHDITWLSVTGYKDPVKVEEVMVASSYLNDDMIINNSFTVLIKEDDRYNWRKFPSGYGFWYPMESTEEYITLKSGTECLLVTNIPKYQSEEDPKEFVLCGYILKNNILYEISVWGFSGDEEEAEKIFFEWANHY